MIIVATLVVHVIAWVVATFVSEVNQMTWTVVGGVLCAAYSVVAMWRSRSTTGGIRIIVASIALSFPVWGTVLYYPGAILAAIVGMPFGGVQFVHGMISSLGGIQGLLFAVLMGKACRSHRLACVIGLAIVPSWFAALELEAVVKPYLSARMLALRGGAWPFLPTLVIVWNALVGTAMTLWAAHRRRHPLPPPIPRCRCGYDHRGLLTTTCPECGQPIAASTAT